ncbi:MAG: penicillin-binding protein 2 [Hyphomicrobiales bacterium]
MARRDFAQRQYIIIFIFILFGVVFIAKLFFLQILDNTYKLSANNAIRSTVQYPLRGLIYDRNGKLLVYNEAAYDLMVIPRQVKDIDTNKFCQLLKIDTDDYIRRMQKAIKFASYKSSIFISQISREDYAYIAENLYKYPGFFVQTRTLRKYPVPIAAHTFGYIGEVNKNEINRDHYYRPGDYIGKSGLEKYYEHDLRGQKGKKYVRVDVLNRKKGSYKEGKYDTIAKRGSNLTISIDSKIQQYAEQLMQNKIGSIVAIEPSSGEILAFVTSPSYDPNLLVGRIRGKNYGMLQNDSLKPLMNRAVMGEYAPGSTFKMITGLIGLQEGAVTERTYFNCEGTASKPMRCSHNHVSPIAFRGAIQQSCNPYFLQTFKSTLSLPKYKTNREAYVSWYNHVRSFGLGQKFNTDIPFELPGNVPKQSLYDKIYKKRWNALTVRSLSIGQGELEVTPLQLANLAVIFGNKGSYYPPHFIKKIDDKKIENRWEMKHTSIDSSYYDIIVEAMEEVFEGAHGTARYYKVPGIIAGGKTGTVQNNRGKDHSVFLAFAPSVKPKIAISVIIENGGFGTRWAAPIASLIMEKYFHGEVKRKKLEERMLNGDLIHKKK